jgi:hypothetical protein
MGERELRGRVEKSDVVLKINLTYRVANRVLYEVSVQVIVMTVMIVMIVWWLYGKRGGVNPCAYVHAVLGTCCEWWWSRRRKGNECATCAE